METNRMKKRFFSSIAECAWLNELGEQGYRLLFRKENSYTFELTEKQWYYRVEWLDCSPESEDGESYIASCKEEGLALAATYSLWAYFVSENPIPESKIAKKRTSEHYRNIACLLYAVNAVVAVLIAYQFAIRNFLEKQLVFLEAPTMEKSSNLIINLARRLVYGAELLLYRYGKFCSAFFGDTKAALALGILIPLAVILAVTASFWLAEWLKNCPLREKVIKQEEAYDVYEESEASGEVESDC